MPSSNGEDFLSKPYVPIDTDVVDNIQHYASDHLHVQIEYRDRDGSKKVMRGFIADVYTNREHEEHLRLEDGRTLRLDQLIQVDAPEDQGNRFARQRDRALELEERLSIPNDRFFPNGIG